MKKSFLYGLTLLTQSVFAANVVSDDRGYAIVEDPKIQLIIADEYKEKSDEILAYENEILRTYEKLYGYALDDTLYLGLASSQNQIPNAFSTQIPLNMQMNYIGGSLLPDYFPTPSWLKMILTHESAHNFQVNAKQNALSRFSHKVFKNSPFTSLFFLPIFPIPNLLESPFLLEGNAVLNESLFKNGGRLYSGEARALTFVQAKAGLITPERTYNQHLFFPYGTHNYFIGAYFQLYLAQKYGLEKVNHYFLAFSDQWLPFFTNNVFTTHFGKSYEQEILGFEKWLLSQAEGMVQTQGEEVAFSKDDVFLNSNTKEIFFLTSDLHSAPRLISIEKQTQKVTVEKTNHLLGKVFKKPDGYYSLSSAMVASDQISIGLFDKNGKLQDGSDGKALQRILPDGQTLYFDVKNSYDGLHLYIDDQFWGIVNSSVWSDQFSNLYYFKQSGKTRTLYKNKTAIFSYEGYYGKVVDIDTQGNILFIGPSKYGSKLYHYGTQGLQSAVDGDDIIDAKLLSDKQVLVEVVRDDAIAFIKTDITLKPDIVFAYRYFFESEDPVVKATQNRCEIDNPQDYTPLTNLHYSALSQSFEITDTDFNFYLNASFTDPLEQNSVSMFISSYDEDTIAGVGYDNEAHLLQYGVSIYGVLEHADATDDRGFGLNTYLLYPWYRHTYEKGDLLLHYTLRSDKDEKSPLSLTLSWTDQKQFAQSFYPNDKNVFSLFGVEDRSDLAYGARYDYMHDIGKEFYIGAGVHYARSDSTTISTGSERGIHIDNAHTSSAYDPTRFVMPSLKSDIYVKEAIRGEFSLSKVLSANAYFFSFPLSLRRESLYAKYRYFNLQSQEDIRYKFHEYTLGTTLDLLFFNKSPLPLSIEYLQNNNLVNENKFRILFDIGF